MRSISLTTATTLAALFTSALANWDSKLCNGAGGCLGTSWFPGTDFVCPDGLKLTNQQVAQNSVDMSSGLYDYVSADAFPKSCLRDVVPGPEAKLIVLYPKGYCSSVRRLTLTSPTELLTAS